jgi:mRNA interferase MazF
MEKNFDGWNEQKKNIHARGGDVFFHEREVWWCSLGVNIGFEQDGTNELFERPILIVKKFNRDVLWILPLTRSDKENQYYVPITVGDDNSTVILSQLRLISSKRLQRYMHKLPQGQLKHIVRLLQQFLPRA